MANSDDKSQTIKLKYLVGVENLDEKKVARILVTVRHWVYYFDELSAGTKKINGDFMVHGFSFGLFDLSTSEDVLALPVDKFGKRIDFSGEPYLFMSDLANFVEQTYFPVPNKFKLTQEQSDELKGLPRLFAMFGVTPRGNTASSEGKITIEELERMEDFHRRQFIIRRIDEVLRILNLEKEAKQEEIKLTSEEKASSTKDDDDVRALAFGSGGSSQSTEPDAGGGEEATSQSDKTDSRPDQPPDQTNTSQPFKISELDSESKLYLQSLSIITINQALGRYFNDASLAQMGFAPGTRVTFDQLPLDIRQQLMDRAFLQVETQLRTGDFNLKDLISGTSSRISFTNQTALNLLIDIRGMQLLNQAVSSLVNKDKDEAAFQEKLSKNKKEELKEEQLSQRVKNDKNITSTKDAEAKINSMKADSGFVERIEKQLEVIGDKKQLDEKLREHLETVFEKLHPEVRDRLLLNLRSLVDVYIQQGLPPEYLINDPKNFDSSKLKNFFGNDLTPQQLEKNKEALASIIVFYWKRKRILWARDFHQEFSQEKYTPEEAIALAAKRGQLPTSKQLELRQLNNTFGSEAVAEALANPNSDLVKNNKVLSDFVQQQQDLIGKQLTTELAKLGEAEQQATLKVYFEFYMPGVVVHQYSVEYFNQKIVPQISPMDYYMLMANSNSEVESFDDEQMDFGQQSFSQMASMMRGGRGRGGGGGEGGDNLIKNDLTRKALEWGIRAAAGAASGGATEAAFQALDKLEAADQTGFVKLIKKQVLDKILDWIQKYWPILLAAAAFAVLGPLLGLLAAAFAGYKLWQSILGAGAKEQALGGIEAANQAGQATAAQTALNQNLAAQQALAYQQGVGGSTLAQNAATVTHGIGTAAMTVAGQAVIATVAASTVFMYVHQTSLNSAFLTNFPRNETELTGNTENQKTSKYAEMTKTAVIKTGCSSPENNGTKCAEPDFPLSIEYTITIKPKEDFAIQITNIEDTIKFKQSEKGWEKAGQTPPSIPDEKFLDFEYFKKLIEEQVGLSDTPLAPVDTSPTPIPSSEPPEEVSPSPEAGYIVIPAGESLTFTYTLDDLTPGYNHTAITNTIEIDFNYQNSYLSGTDNLITGARVCLGECGGDPGCWPMTGTLSQMPFDTDFSHGPNGSNKYWHDAYDIGTGKGPALYGNPVYVPFDGQLCFAGCSNSGYGCYNILTFDNGGEQQKLLFAHFQDPNPSISSPGSCMQVEAGFLIGLSGNRGFSSANHLHYGASHGEAFSLLSNPGFSILETLVPADNAGNKPPKEGVGVTTCYE